MKDYGPSNVIVALAANQVPAKRRLSQPLPKISRRKKFGSAISFETLIDTTANTTTTTSSNSSSSNSNMNEKKKPSSDEKRTRWACHKQVLMSAPYFETLFSSHFSESDSTIVFLPSKYIESDALDGIIHYLYTNEIPKRESIMDICAMYSTADYLGMETCCTLLATTLEAFIHDCSCYCTTCVKSIPQLFPYCQKRAAEHHDERMALMTQKVIQVFASDPEKAIPSFWQSRHMANLLMQLPHDVSLALSQKILYRVNKSNAIESLYACYTASTYLSESDPLLSWSKPLHATLTSVQSRATRTITRYFDFYCCQYPALLSCIDGITYSYGFLEYLLLHLLEDQMDCDNVGMLYEGIVCQLMCRDSVSDQVHHILDVAKMMILQYISRRIGDIRLKGGLDKLKKKDLKFLAQELDVKPKSLISDKHPLSHRGLFSFLLPNIPTVSKSTTTLSRHSSRSTAASLSPPEKTSFSDRITNLFKKLRHSHQEQQGPGQRRNRTRHINSRYASTSTVHTTRSAPLPATSWLSIHLPPKPKERSISFSTATNNNIIINSRKKKNQKKKKNNNRGSSSSRHSGNSSNDGNSSTVSPPLVGMGKRVQLIRRPVATVGTVAFVGHVNFSQGIWIGVELDRRVGKNDGSVDGYRYFTCSPNRGVFVRPEDVDLVA